MEGLNHPCLEYTFCFLDTSGSVQHKFWGCIQARCTWWWVIFIMHELFWVRTGKYVDFNWKQALVRERISKRFAKKIKIWHLLWGIGLWTIWTQRNGRAFNHEQWLESKMKHLIWDDLIMYVKATWARVVKFVKISTYLVKALLKGFDQTWSYKNIHCRWDKRKIVRLAWDGWVACWGYYYLFFSNSLHGVHPRGSASLTSGCIFLGPLTLALWPYNSKHTT